MNKKNDVIVFFVILIISVLMVNPPILNLINQYCINKPQTGGWPTLFLWLELWYAIMILDFVIGACKIKNWNCSQDQKTIDAVERK